MRQAVAEMIEASQKTFMDKINTVLSCLWCFCLSVEAKLNGCLAVCGDLSGVLSAWMLIDISELAQGPREVVQVVSSKCSGRSTVERQILNVSSRLITEAR